MSVNVIDVASEKIVSKIEIPAGESWTRVQFECTPKQTMNYAVTYSPAFWAGDEGKVFYAKRYWSLPETIDARTKAWHITLCYPNDFLEVPMPPTANQHCQCKRAGVSSIE